MAAELRIGSETDGLWLKEFPSLDTGTLPALVYDSSTGEIKYRSVATSYTLPPATDSIRGGVTIGTGINLVGDKISVTPYTLPAATSGSLGGIIPGTGLSMSGSTLNCTVTQVTPVDNILDWNGSSYAPYSSKQSGVCIYLSSEIPNGTSVLGINANVKDTSHYSGGYYFNNITTGTSVTGNSTGVVIGNELNIEKNLTAGSTTAISGATKISAYSNSAIDTLISAQNTNTLFGGMRIGVDSSGNSVFKSGSAYWNWHWGTSDYIKARWTFSTSLITLSTYTAVDGNGTSLNIIASNYSGDVSGRRGGNIQISAGTGYTQGGNITINAGSVTTTGTAGAVYIYGGTSGYTPRVYLGTDGSIDYGQTIFSQGAVGAPSICFRGSYSTGLFLQSSNNIGVSINGTERFRFTSAGQFHAADDIVAFSTTPSDIRLKENIEYIDSEEALNKVCNLKGSNFNIKGSTKQRIGFIAQDVREVLPEIIDEVNNVLGQEYIDADKYLTVRYIEIIPLLVEAIKALNNKLNVK